MQLDPSVPVALVTGASTGIGAATAVAFAAQGTRVAVHYNASKEAARGVFEKVTASGGTAHLFQADLSSREEAKRLVSQVLNLWDRIDVLVNNAGSMIGRKALEEITPEFWQQVMDVNVSSALWVTQEAVPQMRRRSAGAIINVTSVAARNGGSAGVMPYAAAKAAVLCMTKGLAKELIVDGIRVNAVSPGIITTPFHEKFTPDEVMRGLIPKIPQGRAGTAEEVARVITFLAGDGASHIVGETIEINGGLLMD